MNGGFGIVTYNGAQTLLLTLLAGGVRVCFTNPGTSELHLVAALDSVCGMRAVLTLFEGVATGAADGYARMSDAPAATLLHLGPGLGNGLANLHNARRAGVPVVNIVGDHAGSHAPYDTPLQSDIETVARNVSGWVRTARGPQTLARDALEAIAAAVGPPAAIATLIVPADVSWQEGSAPGAALTLAAATPPEIDRIQTAAAALAQGGDSCLLLGGRALHERGLIAAARVAAATGARLLAQRNAARLQRGPGRPAVERLAYWPEQASRQLEGMRLLVLAGAPVPASLFAYPNRPSLLAPQDCQLLELPGPDPIASLEALVSALDAGGAAPSLQGRRSPALPQGGLTAQKVCQAVAALLPEEAIICDESVSSAPALEAATAGAAPHDWLTLTGGAIGQGLAVAVGAAVACPDRPVIALQSDGAAMYTIQSLWTMAREQLDVTVVILANRAYGILATELARMGGRPPGRRAAALVDLSRPPLDFVALGEGLGVPSRRADTAELLLTALREALSAPGPHLIEALLPASAG
jgi:acetolactate synthase-1/2/3 large subunit